MSNNRFVWTGLEELKQELRQLPADLTAEASGIVDNAAEYAKSSIIQGYPPSAGDLREHVTIETIAAAGQFGVGLVVKNTSKLAWMFENGTEARHYITVNGVRHPTGRILPLHVFLPPVIRWRRWMWTQLSGLVERKGLRVTGEA